MKRLMTLVSVMALMIVPGVTATGAEGLTPRESSARIGTRVQLGPIHDLDEEVEAFIQLDEQPVAAYVATRDGATRSAQQAQAQRVRSQQAELRSSIDGEELYSLEAGANGIAVRASIRDLMEIAERPDVVAVTRLEAHEFENATSVPWIGTPDVWENLGFTGDGVSIGIIDTGIDYLHADFGGPGTEEAYASNDPTTLADGGFTVKVAGGYDFVGDDYNASDPDNDTPQPDPDPLDCNGHGTHVAGSAAGQGVLADGTTYTGPYDSSIFGNEFEVGPGVAPEATLYALKVFGCDGSTLVTAEAIEWALDPNGDGSIDDHLDVINMSLGSDYGQPNDPTAIASSNAMDVGMLVVSAAGNDGPVPYVHGSPASSRKAIAVAASIDGGVTVGALTVNSPDAIAGQYEAAEAAITPPLDETGPLSGDLAVAEPLDGCGAITNGDAIAGNIAFIQRGTCTFSEKILNAQAVGAAGVVVFNNVEGPPIVMGGDETGIEIPAVMVGLEDGNLISDTISGGDTVNVTLDSSVVIPKPELADTLADFTSQGPRGRDLFGPDVAAPGFSIDSAAVGTGSAGVLNSGTSMATPHVAGLVALMREAHPGANTQAIKSMLMNTTTDTNGAYPTTLMGTGVVQADAALAADAFTWPSGFSFGRVNPTETTTLTRTVSVRVLSGEGRTYSIEHSPIQQVPGVSVSVPDSVTVNARSVARFQVTMTLDPSAMPSDDGFYSQTEVDGIVTLSSGDSNLRVGYVGVVDPASDVSASSTSGGAVEFVNDGAADGYVDTFTRIAPGTGSIATVGVRSLDDLTSIEFGVASRKAWDSLSRREIDIFIDTDEDGTDDYVLVAADLGYLQGAGATGTVVTALFNLADGSGFLEYYVIADLNDRVQVLPVDVYGDFGFLEDGDTTFDFTMVDLDIADQDGEAVFDGMASGSVDLESDVTDVGNVSGVLPAGAVATVPIGSPGDRLIAMYSNNQVRDQFQGLRLRR